MNFVRYSGLHIAFMMNGKMAWRSHDVTGRERKPSLRFSWFQHARTFAPCHGMTIETDEREKTA